MHDDIQKEQAIQKLNREKKRITGFEAPMYLEQKFEKVRAKLFAVFDPFVGDGKHDNTLGRFLQLINGIENGLYASIYHLNTIEKKERAIKKIAISIFKEVPIPANTTGSIGGGDTRQLDYEYQAFHLALRRTFEYLAQLVSYTLDLKRCTFRELPKAIKKKELTPFNEKMISCHEKIMRDCSELIGPRNNGGQSIRDQIAHYDAVDFGCFNVAWYDEKLTVFFAGGGHKTGPNTKATLASILGADVEKVESAVFDMLSAMNFPLEDHIH